MRRAPVFYELPLMQGELEAKILIWASRGG
jgi:hypothetical protein